MPDVKYVGWEFFTFFVCTCKWKCIRREIVLNWRCKSSKVVCSHKSHWLFQHWKLRLIFFLLDCLSCVAYGCSSENNKATSTVQVKPDKNCDDVKFMWHWGWTAEKSDVKEIFIFFRWVHMLCTCGMDGLDVLGDDVKHKICWQYLRLNDCSWGTWAYSWYLKKYWNHFNFF